MVEKSVKSLEITNIELNANVYRITVPIKQSLLEDKDEYYFTLKERYSENIIYLPSSISEQAGDYSIINLNLSFNEYKQTFLSNEIWDININLKKEGQVNSKRIKSNYSNIRFQTIVLPEIKKMFYPYTTKKGKLSFRINDYFMFSKLENVQAKNGRISFTGYFNFPPLYQTRDYKIIEMSLIVTNNINDNEVKLPIKQIKVPELAEMYPGNENLVNSGIEGYFDVNEHIFTDQNIYFKFYLEAEIEEAGEMKKVRSTRVRCNHLKNHYLRNIISHKNRKIKIKVKPTKESKYLSIRVSDYNFKNEVVKKVKSKWVEIRRGNLLKEAYKGAFYLLGKLPVKKKVVMFESFLGKQYSDSPRAIYEYIMKNNDSFDMYWSVDRRHMGSFEDKDVHCVRRFSIKWLLLMARAGYWVSNSRLPLWIPKPNHTTYLQTWHGTPLKRLATDMDEVHMPGTNIVKYKQNFLKEASKWDYLVSPNAYSTEIFKRAFQFNNTLIESGYPRNDFLINSNNDSVILEIKKKIKIPTDKKIVLYAPTWRDNQFYGRGRYKFSLQMNLDQMRESLGDEYIILLRLHYLVAENLDLSEYEGFVYDLSSHEDIRELYLVSDILITDYSSVFFDYANLKRPMLFFVYDIDEYRDSLRGFYFDFEEKAPGPLVKTTEGILDVINEIEENGFTPSQSTEEFYNKFCYLEDGKASERVVNEVFKLKRNSIN